MTAYLTIVSSKNCPACRTCEPLVRKVSSLYPDVTVLFWDFDDPHVRKFHARNLKKSVRSLPDPQMREYYLQQGLEEISGLPTIFISTSHRPLVVVDMLIGCVDTKADYVAKEKMMKDIERLFKMARSTDYTESLTSVGRNERRSAYYGV